MSLPQYEEMDLHSLRAEALKRRLQLTGTETHSDLISMLQNDDFVKCKIIDYNHLSYDDLKTLVIQRRYPYNLSAMSC